MMRMQVRWAARVKTATVRWEMKLVWKDWRETVFDCF